MADELKDKVAKGAVWATLEQLCAQGISFGMGIILARLLTPDDYGTVALVTIFLSVALVLVNSGLGKALVQKSEIDGLDVNSVFYVSSAISWALYGVLFLFAPTIAAYYRIAELTPIVRVLALNLPLYALNSVQNVELYRQMKFHLTFRIAVITASASAVVGVGLALLGFGVWSLVWSSLCGAVASVIARGFVTTWRPRLTFSWTRVRTLFDFGWKIMAGDLLESMVSNLYGLVIGRCYSQADLAFVNKGRNIPDILQSNINTSLVEVSFPALVRLQQNRERLLNALSRLLSVSSFVMFPCMFFLAAVSENAILFLYGEKWTPCIPYMQIVCVMGSTITIAAVNLQAILAIGRSDVHLKLTIFRNVASVTILFACISKGVLVWLFVSCLLFGPLSSLVGMICASRVVGYTLRRQFSDFMPNVLIGFVSIIPVLLLNTLVVSRNPLILGSLLFAEAVVTGALVLVLAVSFRTCAARELVAILRRNKMLSGMGFVAWIYSYFEGERN